MVSVVSVTFTKKSNLNLLHSTKSQQLYFHDFPTNMYLTIRLLANRHPAFIARTVFVKNNDVDDACRLVNRIIGKEGLLEQFRLTRYYEKPFQVLAPLESSLY